MTLIIILSIGKEWSDLSDVSVKIASVQVGTVLVCTTLRPGYGRLGRDRDGGAVTIPSTLGGFPVTSIGDKAFAGCTDLTSISLSQGLTSIGEMAFYECKGLTSISLQKGLISIGKSAFGGCGLTSISIPQGVTSIDNWTFDNCTSLISITFNSATTTISDDAYVIPATTKIIGYDPSTAKTYATKYNRTFEVIGSTTNVKVTKVSLNKKTTSITIGANETLIATIAPTTATNKDVTWKSSKTSVATVDSNGNIAGVKAGTATITVTTVDGKKTATCKVTVKSPPIVKVTKVSLNKKITTINVGANETLIPTVSPTTATNQNVTWKSSKASVATVDSNGKVVGVKAGTAVITVTTVDGKKTATCTVTVTAI